MSATKTKTGLKTADAASKSKVQQVFNQNYDEALELSESEEVASQPSPEIMPRRKGDTPPSASVDDAPDDSEEDFEGTTKKQPGYAANNAQLDESHDAHHSGDRMDETRSATESPQTGGDKSLKGKSDDEETETEDEDEEHNSPRKPENGYNPADYKNMTVNDEVRDLFQYITKYKPQEIELENELKPFIPEYIPAVGDIDAFIKIPRADVKPDNLGLTVLDEPCGKQTDPTVLDLQLRAVTKAGNLVPVNVRSIENPSSDTGKRAMEDWIKSVSELHLSKPAPVVHYTKPMPDIEKLMQEWPKQIEDLFSTIELPGPNIDVDLPTYVKLVAVLLDIPVSSTIVETLHVLFTLYSEFKNSQHFRTIATEEPKLASTADTVSKTPTVNVDILVS